MGKTSLAITVQELTHMAQQGPVRLFAVLDAAASDEMRGFIEHLGLPYEIVYEGRSPQAGAASVAPYLIECLATDPETVATLVETVWGEACAVFLQVPRAVPWETLHRHLCDLLSVELDNGESLYFRYYDPRILRVFLPTCDEAQTVELFGPIDRMMMEGDEAGNMLAFTRPADGVGASGKKVGYVHAH